MGNTPRWSGLMTDADPNDLPPGACQEQTNLACRVPGRLEVRKGFGQYSYPAGPEEEEHDNFERPVGDPIFAPPSMTGPAGVQGTPIAMFRMRTKDGESVVWQSNGKIWIGGANGSNSASEELTEDLDANDDPKEFEDTPCSFAQTRKGHLIRVNGLRRGSIRIGDKTYPLGIKPAGAAPTITTVAGGKSYEGTYYCAYRYRDADGNFSSLSPLAEVAAMADKTFQHKVAASDEDRVTEIEIYRSTADEAITLYLVGVIPNGATASFAWIRCARFTGAGSTVIHLKNPLTCAIPAGTTIQWNGISVRYNQTTVNTTLSEDAGSGDTSLTIGALNGILTESSTASYNPVDSGVSLSENNADDDLVSLASLPLNYDDGMLCARRQEPPPDNMRVVVPFQDRHFYAVTEDNAEERNAVYYSEPDEPESVPRSQNAIIIADDQEDADAVTALFTYGGSLYVAKTRHLYRLSYSFDPALDGSCRLVVSRGILHQRAWTLAEDVCYAMDQYGAWRMAGGQVESISGPIQNYWREGLLDFNRRDRWFVSYEPNEQVIRYHVLLLKTDKDCERPIRALCYGVRTGAWWWEEYPMEIGAACRVEVDGRMRTLAGVENGLMVMSEGDIDLRPNMTQSAFIGKPISFSLKTGMMALPEAQEGKSPAIPEYQIVLEYDPTTAEETVDVRVFWDTEPDGALWWEGSMPNASASARSRTVTIHLSANRSKLGRAVGRERWPFRARTDPRALTRRALCLEMEGRATHERPVFHSLDIQALE